MPLNYSVIGNLRRHPHHRVELALKELDEVGHKIASHGIKKLFYQPNSGLGISKDVNMHNCNLGTFLHRIWQDSQAKPYSNPKGFSIVGVLEKCTLDGVPLAKYIDDRMNSA